MIVMMLIILVMMTMTMMDDDDDGVPPIPLADSGIHCQTSSPLFNRSNADDVVFIVVRGANFRQIRSFFEHCSKSL